MSCASAIVEQFTSARAQLDSVCELLLSPSPQAVDQGAGLLESAGRRMLDCRAMIADARGNADALEEAWNVRRSFLRAAKLLENAARFHQNWSGIRGAMTGGYTDRGEPAPVRHAGRVCLEA